MFFIVYPLNPSLVDRQIITKLRQAYFQAELLKQMKNIFAVPIKDRTQCYASLHSDFHEHLLRHAGKACHREGCITLTTNILQIHACIESPRCLTRFVCFPIVIKTLLHDFDHDI